MPASKSHKCPSCSESVTKSSGGVICRICSQWFHNECAKISEKELQAMRVIKFNAFMCSHCESNLNSDRNQNDGGIANGFRDLNKKLDDFMADNRAELTSIKSSLDDIKSEVSSCLSEMKADIAECGARVLSLEAENNVLHRRLNRADIVVAGLPQGLDDLVSPVVALGAVFKLSVTSQDIHYACYISNRRQILVKFNSVFLRDRIMREYFKTRTLKVGDLLQGDGSDLSSRVYLNDHFSPAAGQLNAVCRKLLRLRVISKFKILNGDNLKAKLTLLNGNMVTRNLDECTALLDGSNGNAASCNINN